MAIVGDVITTVLFVGLGTSLVEDPRLILGALAGFVLLYALLPVVRRLAPNTLIDSRPSRSEP